MNDHKHSMNIEFCNVVNNGPEAIAVSYSMTALLSIHYGQCSVITMQ